MTWSPTATSGTISVSALRSPSTATTRPGIERQIGSPSLLDDLDALEHSILSTAVLYHRTDLSSQPGALQKRAGRERREALPQVIRRQRGDRAYLDGHASHLPRPIFARDRLCLFDEAGNGRPLVHP